jgi:hypothetical protein
MDLRLCNIYAWVNGPNIGKMGFFVLQVWYNSITTMGHVTREKPKKLFKGLGDGVDCKVVEGSKGLQLVPLVL